MRERYKEGFIKFCFANCIAVDELINIILVYTGIGLASNSLRRILFIGALVMFMMVSIGILFTKRKEYKWINKSNLILAIFLAYYVYGILYSLSEYGMTLTWKEYVPQLIVMGIPSLCWGLIGARSNMLKDFFVYLEKGSLIVLPIAAYYAFVHWFGIANMHWNYGKDVGPLSYMYLANAFMPYMLAHMFSFMFESERKIEWFRCQIPLSQLLRVLIIGIYWIAILASGTRGIMLSSAFSMIIMIVIKLFWKSGVKRIWLPISLLFFALFLGFVWAPKGMSEGGIHRWDYVLEGIKEGKLATDSENVFESDEQIGDFIEERTNEIKESCDKNKEETEVSGQENDMQANEIDMNQFDREDLFRLAIEEFKRHPIVGIGTIGFSVKYGMAPHSIALEVLCETGIIGAIIYIGSIVYVLIMWIFKRQKPQYEVLLLCFLITYILKLNISGYLWWHSNIIMFSMALGATLIGDYAKE